MRSAVACLLVALLAVSAPDASSGASGEPAPLPSLPEAARTDECGLPCFLHEGRILYNPAYLAQAAADPGLPEAVREAAWNACLERLSPVRAGTREADLLMYDYRYPYHGRVIDPPFPSAYAQAAWVRACLFRLRTAKDPDAPDRLNRAANGFLIGRRDGGFFAPVAGWFEELPDARILNGHLDATLALFDAAASTGDGEHLRAALRAAEAARGRLADFDAGDWSRYDLDANPRERLFAWDWEGEPGAAPLLERLEATWGWGTPRALDLAGAEAWDGPVRLAGTWPLPTGAPSAMAGRAIPPLRHARPDPSDLYGIAHRALAALSFAEDPRETMPEAWARPGAPRPAIRARFRERGRGRVVLRVRDDSLPERYAFRPFATVECAGGGLTRAVELPLSPRDLAHPVGLKYHRLHIELLRSLAERPELVGTPAPEAFAACADRFAAYLARGRARDARPKAPRIRCARTREVALAHDPGAAPDPGNEPARLVDGEENTVLILRPDGLDRTFEVAFAHPVALHGVGVDFYAEPFVPGALALGAGTVETFVFASERPASFWANLDPAPTLARATFRFTGPSERGPVIVRELRFLIDPDRPALEALAVTLPPLPAGGGASWGEILELESRLRARFPLGFPRGSGVRDIVASGVAQCADRVALLGGLLDLAGIEWRPINFHNAPTMGEGHSAMEIWQAGAWRYLDPSFGWFAPGPDGPRPFAELAAHPELSVAGTPAPGSPDMKGLNAPEFFRRADPAGPAGPLSPMAFPVEVGSAGVELGAFGPAADGDSCRDLDSMFAPGLPAGLAYVGQSLEHRSVEFRFGALPPATWEVTLVPAYVTDDKFELKLSSEGGALDGPPAWRPSAPGFRTDEVQVCRVRFVQEREGAKLVVGFAPGRYPSYMELDAIRVERVNSE